ncbi:DUF3566 domain-containing protein [Demequina pelophila]|uniref:DUF3566 domain-containing protein n=1 Tax=Demequina pelophila TaxID=1638984 RepID=UPI0007859D9C|nr:DUF3566 domain-containing protein [Demequina pelophila]
MNADNRTPQNGRGLYSPRATEDAPAARTRSLFMPVNPEAESDGGAPAAPSAPAPSTGSVPQRTALRPQTAPSGIPTLEPDAEQPAPAARAPRSAASGEAATAPRAYAPATPAPTSAPQTAGQPAARTQTFAPTTAEPAAAPQQPAAQPVPGQQAEGPRPAWTSGAAGAALGAGGAKLRGYAVRAKESFTEGDELHTPESKGGPRKARVLLSRIDPWSALKLGFLLSIAVGIMFVVAVFVLWNVLDSMGVFVLINDWVVQLFTTEREIDIMQFFDRNKIMSAAILLSVVNVVLITALATLASFLYNVVSSVVGGVYVTLTDD